MRLSRDRISIPQLMTGLPCVRLTYVGAKSGLLRTIPTIGVPNGDNIALICSNYGQARNPGWYHNLKKKPVANLALLPLKANPTAGSTRLEKSRTTMNTSNTGKKHARSILVMQTTNNGRRIGEFRLCYSNPYKRLLIN